VVRVLVRDPSTAAVWAGKVDVSVGDLSAPETLTAALPGVTSVFLLAGPGGQGVAQTKNIVDALKASGQRPQVVVLSSLGAGEPTMALAQMHADREALVRDSGLPWTMLRPGMFMSNTFSWARTVKTESKVVHSFGEGSISPIAPSDIALVAAVVLTEGTHKNQVLNLSGPQALTTAEQVASLSRVLGRPIECQDISVEQAIDGMIKGGMPPFVAQNLGELNRMVRNTPEAPVHDTVFAVTGRQPVTYEDWARENAAAWR